MPLKFKKIAVDVADQTSRFGPDDYAWATVKLTFEDDAELFPNVAVEVSTSNDGTQTLAALHENAVTEAKAVLKAALQALEDGTYASLVAEQRRIEDARYKRGSTTFDGGTTTFDDGTTTFD